MSRTKYLVLEKRYQGRKKENEFLSTYIDLLYLHFVNCEIPLLHGKNGFAKVHIWK